MLPLGTPRYRSRCGHGRGRRDAPGRTAPSRPCRPSRPGRLDDRSTGRGRRPRPPCFHRPPAGVSLRFVHRCGQTPGVRAPRWAPKSRTTAGESAGPVPNYTGVSPSPVVHTAVESGGRPRRRRVRPVTRRHGDRRRVTGRPASHTRPTIHGAPDGTAPHTASGAPAGGHPGRRPQWSSPGHRWTCGPACGRRKASSGLPHRSRPPRARRGQVSWPGRSTAPVRGRTRAVLAGWGRRGGPPVRRRAAPAGWRWPCRRPRTSSAGRSGCRWRACGAPGWW